MQTILCVRDGAVSKLWEIRRGARGCIDRVKLSPVTHEWVLIAIVPNEFAVEATMRGDYSRFP